MSDNKCSKKINLFIKEIQHIEKQLSSLEDRFSNAYESYLGNDFDEQNLCASEIENTVLMLTHELGSEINFRIHCLETLLKYIHFRKNYHEYCNEDLSNLIDKTLNVAQKREITQGKKDKNIAQLIAEWNTIFENMSYEKIKNEIGLTTQKKE